jgi:predicted alpha/beta-hydrolase family hydrolase
MTLAIDDHQTSATYEGEGATGIVLAHGAGAGQDSEWMSFFRSGLAGHGFTVMTFDYLYITAGRKRPDQMPRLLACHGVAVRELASRCNKVVLAGKSMGGRVGGHLASEDGGAAAVVFFGYPLVPIGKTEPRDISHLRNLDAPILFVSGTRDRMGPLGLLRPLAAELKASVVEVEDGDHSLKVRKSSGRSTEEAWTGAIDRTAAWLHEVVAQG